MHVGRHQHTARAPSLQIHRFQILSRHIPRRQHAPSMPASAALEAVSAPHDDDAATLQRLLSSSVAELMQEAVTVRDLGHPRVITFSPKVRRAWRLRCSRCSAHDLFIGGLPRCHSTKSMQLGIKGMQLIGSLAPFQVHSAAVEGTSQEEHGLCLLGDSFQ